MCIAKSFCFPVHDVTDLWLMNLSRNNNVSTINIIIKNVVLCFV